jgi:hypothetical protein
MTLAIALVSLALFVVSFRLAKILPIALQAMSRVQTATAVLADRGKTDDEKERAARESSKVLFGSFLLITALTCLALVPSSICIALAIWGGLTGMDEIMDALVSVPLIVAAVVFFAADYVINR